VTTQDEGGGASRSTDPAAGTSAATDISLREYFEALRKADDKYQHAEEKFQQERDRRYSEVAIEREKALAIKERADETARLLVAENQAYKDEKANELREQISSERGRYLTREEYLTAHTALIDKFDSALKPLSQYVTAQSGGPRAITAGMLLAALGGIATILTIIVLGLVLTR
jgi:hypothetical protein